MIQEEPPSGKHERPVGPHNQAIAHCLIIREVFMKYLFLIVLIGVVWWVWKKRNQSDQQSSQAHDPAPAPQKMLVCAQCGVYFPESDGLSDGEKVYCCEAHRLAASREADGR